MGWRYQAIPNPISMRMRAAVAVVLGLLGRRVGLMRRLVMVGMGLSRRGDPQGQDGEHGQPERLSEHRSQRRVEAGQREGASRAGATVSARQPQPGGHCYRRATPGWRVKRALAKGASHPAIGVDGDRCFRVSRRRDFRKAPNALRVVVKRATLHDDSRAIAGDWCSSAVFQGLGKSGGISRGALLGQANDLPYGCTGIDPGTRRKELRQGDGRKDPDHRNHNHQFNESEGGQRFLSWMAWIFKGSQAPARGLSAQADRRVARHGAPWAHPSKQAQRVGRRSHAHPAGRVLWRIWLMAQ